MHGGFKDDRSCVPYQRISLEHFIGTGRLNLLEFGQLLILAIILSWLLILLIRVLHMTFGNNMYMILVDFS
jgi:hypothetical protein